MKKPTIPFLLRTVKQCFMALFLATLLYACNTDQTPRQLTDEREALPVRVQEVHLTQVPQAYRYSGSVKGLHKVHLSTRLMGRITNLTVEEGDRVQEGQVLVRIQDTDVRAQKAQVEATIQEAQAGYTSAELNYNRMKTLYNSESATKKELEDATTQFEMAEAQIAMLNGRLEEVNDRLSYANIVAPISGYVVQKNVDSGDMAVPGQPLLAIENTSDLEVRATVPESDVNLFKRGDSILVEVDAIDATLPGKIAQINPASSSSGRQFEVVAAIDHNDQINTLKSGMHARVVLEKTQRSVITVPETALTRRGQLTGVYTVDQQNRAMLRWVRTGKPIGDHVEILSGLQEGELFVAAYEGRLIDGHPVRVLN